MFQGTSLKTGQKSTDEVIRLIDLQVANLRESIRVLLSQRNSYLPISKLPVEILSKIFLLHKKNMRHSEIRPLDWIGITHVSQRWREVALNVSGLWIHIPFHNPKWAKEMIARSQPAALIVKASYHSADNPQAKLLKSFLQQHLSRVQVLHIWHTNPQLVAELFQDIQPTSVPCLSTLSLSLPKFLGPRTNSAVLDLLQIVDSRLLNTKSLRKVEVSTALGWDFKLFSSLTHLNLGNSNRAMTRTRASQRGFLDALRRMPTLQHLHLKGPVLPESVDRSSLEPVYLPDLRDLSVFDTVSTIEFFLYHVIFSATTRTAVGCKHLGPVLRFADISRVLVPLKRLLSERPRSLRLHHIEVSFHRDPEDYDIIHLRFQGWVFPGPSSLMGYSPKLPSCTPGFTFFVEWNSGVDILPADIDEFSVGVFALFPEDGVVSLSLSSLSSYDILTLTDLWFRPFFRKISQLPALNALFLHDISFAELLLEPNCDIPGVINPSMATYPALLYLDFSYCLLNTPALKTLYRCLEKRSERSLGPRNLRMDLRGQKVSKRAAVLLEKVAEVVWVMDSDFVDSD